MEVKKGEKEIEVKKEVKAVKIASQKLPDMEVPGFSKSEIWAANIPGHHLEGYAQKDRKDIKEHELTQEQASEENDESESESEEEDSGDEADQ